jgi:phage/plasmid-like protein (TIGR03299 family)
MFLPGVTRHTNGGVNMAHAWDQEAGKQGFFVRTPSWHQLEDKVLLDSPVSWEDARRQANLTWEVQSEPVYSRSNTWAPTSMLPTYSAVAGWQAIVRDDLEDGNPGRILAVQKDTYAVIKNADYGDVIDTVLGRGKDSDDDPLNFEALFSLYGGRAIIALMNFEEPLKMSWDPSDVFRFLAFISRHDGNGGLRILPTNVRIVCGNTWSAAEAADNKGYGTNIRHTRNWQDRLAEVSRGIMMARGDTAKWMQFSEELAMWKVNNRQRDRFLTRFMPASDDMTTRIRDNVMKSRDQVRTILSSATCEGIEHNGYGLLQAAGEYADWGRTHKDQDSLVSRQVLIKDPLKVNAARILADMAGVK